VSSTLSMILQSWDFSITSTDVCMVIRPSCAHNTQHAVLDHRGVVLRAPVRMAVLGTPAGSSLPTWLISRTSWS
jgi:hypothetical protein